MRVRLLGPIDVTVDGVSRPVAGLRRKAMLAVLSLRAGEIVSTSQLIDVIWGDRVPATIANTLQRHVSYLRGVLGVRGAIVARAPGYVLTLAREATDVEAAERLIGRGQQERDPTDRAATLRAALALWRGEALAEVGALSWLDIQAQRLAELRLTATRALIDTRLALGEHARLVPELEQLARQHPFDEGLHRQLMLALHRSGRQADALATYRRLRHTLDEDLGIDPSPPLRELETAILRHDPALDLPPVPIEVAPFVPAQLPAAPPAFVGRQTELARLDATPSTITVVSGTAGVGKTALAVHWAHRIRDRFPDGQLYVNLNGYAASPPVGPGQALSWFLRALGVPAERIPLDVEEAAALYRSALAGRRMLVVLDNAADAEQVRPLVPGSPQCLVLVTSRDRLGGLVASAGARLVAVDVLDTGEARALLAGILGDQRVDGEPAAVAELTELCGYLPLALRIAAANLMLHPRSRIADHVVALRDGDRLAELQVDGDERSGLRTAFDLSYRGLSPGEQRLFRLLGLVPGPDVGLAAAAALAGTSPAETRQALRRLVGGHLVDEARHDRYGFHDLMRLYARSMAETVDGPQETDAALDRLGAYYLGVVDQAAGLTQTWTVRLPGTPAPTGPAPFADRDAALRWLDTERPNVIALIRHSVESRPRRAWQLADALRGYLFLRQSAADWLAAATDGLRAAQAGGDLPAQAAAHLSLGTVHNTRGNPRAAQTHLNAALELAERAQWVEGQAAVRNNLGTVYERIGRPRLAAAHLVPAIALFRQAGNSRSEALSLDNLGMVRRALGQLDSARALHLRALPVHREAGQAVGFTLLGETLCQLGQLDAALRHHTNGHALHQRIGNRNREAMSLCGMATVHTARSDYDRAERLALEALAIAEDVADHRTQARARVALGTIHHRRGHDPLAADQFRRALRLARRSANLEYEAAALTGLARTDRGHPLRALATIRRALGIARRTGLRLREADALAGLAGIRLTQGRHRAAAAAARAALGLRARTGYRLDYQDPLRIARVSGLRPASRPRIATVPRACAAPWPRAVRRSAATGRAPRRSPGWSGPAR